MSEPVQKTTVFLLWARDEDHGVGQDGNKGLLCGIFKTTDSVAKALQFQMDSTSFKTYVITTGVVYE